MPYKLSKKSKIYWLLSFLLVSSITVITTSANAQEQACVITNSGKKVCGKLIRDNNEDKSNMSSQSIVKVTCPTSAVADIQLLKCSRKTNIVSCKFTATITEERTKEDALTFYSASDTKVSQATDNKGEDYIAEKVIIGKSENKRYLSATALKYQPISVTLLFKIPVGVNNIKTLSFLTGNYYTESAARFSNINISQ